VVRDYAAAFVDINRLRASRRFVGRFRPFPPRTGRSRGSADRVTGRWRGAADQETGRWRGSADRETGGPKHPEPDFVKKEIGGTVYRLVLR
jgi:hypothetical protein